MLWHTLSMPGMDVSPVARPAWMSWRAISRLVQLLLARCWRSHVPKFSDMLPCLLG